MQRKLKTEDQLTAYITKRKRQKRMLFTLCILSLLVAVGTFRLLALPAVTLTGDPNVSESDTVPADSSAPASSEEETAAASSSDAASAGGSDTAVTEGGDAASSNSNNGASSEGDGVVSSEGDGVVPSEGDGVVPSEGDGVVPSEGDGVVPSEGDGVVPSEDDGVVPSEGNEGEHLEEAQVPLAELPTEYKYDDGNGLTVTAVPEDPTSIPEGAEFHTDRITQESDPQRYEQYQELLTEENKDLVLPAFNAYDIYFLVNGERVEPDSGTVSVTIVDITDAAIAPDDATVFHVLNEDTDPTLETLPLGDSAADTTEASIDTADADQGITFTTDSFSVFLTMSDTSDSSKMFQNGTLVLPSGYTFENTAFYDSSRALGIAGFFHIVAFDTVRINADCCGNILAKNLTEYRDFGTKKLTGSTDTGGYGEVSYIQNYAPGCDTNGPRSSDLPSDLPSDLLVLGSGNTVEWIGKQLKINNYLAGNPTTVWQDENTSVSPFINLTQVKHDTETLSKSLAAMAPSDNTILEDKTSSDNQYQDNFIHLVNPDSIGVYKISANKLTSSSNSNVRGNGNHLGVTGFTSGTNGVVIINVDCSEVASDATLYLPACTPYIDKTEKTTHEETIFGNNRVLWNFTVYDNNSKTYSPFSGTITTEGASQFYSSILAPDANVICDSNMNGTLIGNNVTTKDHETHRDDFLGKIPCSFTLAKVWKDANGGTLSDLAGLSIKVQLYQGAAAYGTEITLNGTTGWTYSWSNLPRGYTYSVEETGVFLTEGETVTDVTDQYASVAEDSDNGCTITNSKKPQSYELPETGGPGTYAYTAGGLSLILASSLLFWKRKWRREDCS